MLDKIKKISSFHIILFTAIMLIALFAARGVAYFAIESSAVKNGSLENYTLSAEDFVWNGVRNKDGVIITTDNDPQLLLETQQAFTSVEFYMESSLYPGEMVVYYTEPGDEGFSPRKRLWITPSDQQNWYVVETGMKNITSLRIDPTMYAGNVLTFGDFVFNTEKSIGDYFAVSYGDVYNLIIYTGIISSVLKFLQEILKREID